MTSIDNLHITLNTADGNTSREETKQRMKTWTWVGTDCHSRVEDETKTYQTDKNQL